MRHPARRGTWSDDAILDALRRWVAQTGHAPRRLEWAGTEPDHAGSAQRKWMREHPAWPSASCVTAHFGSWSAALEAAGVATRRLTFDEPVAERVETAARLRGQGLSVARIAAHMGVSRSTAANYLRAARCPECGGPVVRPGAAQCAACTRHEPTVPREWSRESARAALAEWRAEHGAAPTYRDWTPCRERPGRWEAESPRWPSAAVVCHLYADRDDPWNAALVDAGERPRIVRFSDDAVRDALAAFWARTGRPPRRADLKGPLWSGPSERTIARRYGGPARAWETLEPLPEDMFGPAFPVELLLVPALARLAARTARRSRVPSGTAER